MVATSRRYWAFHQSRISENGRKYLVSLHYNEAGCGLDLSVDKFRELLQGTSVKLAACKLEFSLPILVVVSTSHMICHIEVSQFLKERLSFSEFRNEWEMEENWLSVDDCRLMVCLLGR